MILKNPPELVSSGFDRVKEFMSRHTHLLMYNNFVATQV